MSSDAKTNTVVVGPHSALARTIVDVDGDLYVPVDRAAVKLRYRSDPVAARVEQSDHGFRLALASPSYGVAPGQAAVLYDGDVVVGAGKICRSA